MENYGSWSILTTNFLYVLYLALCGVTLSSVLHLVNGKWRFQIRNLACAFTALFPLAGILLLILLVNGEATFPWLAHAHDEGHHLPGWNNYTFLVTREIVGFLVVWAVFRLFIRYQAAAEIDSSYAAQRRFRNIALLIPFFYFLYGTMVAWDFEMTMLPGWHSASYAPYHFQSNFHMFLGFFVVFLYFMHRSGRLTRSFQPHIFNYMAQFILAMTILWTYLYFTQYLIMWYGRLPGDMDRYNAMMQGYPTLWWTFLTLKFIIPFTTFVLTPNRHNPTVIMVVGACVAVGTWLERYTWISGSVDPAFYHTPMSALSDIVITVFVFAAAWWLVRRRLLAEGLVQPAAASAAETR